MRTHFRAPATLWGLVWGVATALVIGACATFDITNENQPTLDDLLSNPTRAKLTSVATGIFAQSRDEIDEFIWRLGSMGREGANLAGNNQPDYQEPFFGPLNPSQFGGALWRNRYAAIRTINVYLAGVAKTGDLTAVEKSASVGFGKTLKALAFLYIVQTRAQLGAPVDVDRPVQDPPAPFVSEDSVYGYIRGLLDSAQVALAAGGGAFPFPLPPGYTLFATPTDFIKYNRALSAKAEILRATAGCGAPCFTQALADLGGSFLVLDATQFKAGAYFDFSSNDLPNPLTESPAGTTFFADSDIVFNDAQQQVGGQPDQRVLDKLEPAQDPYTLSGWPFTMSLKFSIYTNAGAADENIPIPIIRNEELILLRAEANIGLGNKAAAITDLDFIRQNSGNLPATTLTAASPDTAFVTELLYNRRYSLLWEQGTRWTDARRYGRLATIPVWVTPGGEVPTVMPVPADECNARNLTPPCTP